MQPMSCERAFMTLTDRKDCWPLFSPPLPSTSCRAWSRESELYSCTATVEYQTARQREVASVRGSQWSCPVHIACRARGEGKLIARVCATHTRRSNIHGDV